MNHGRVLPVVTLLTVLTGGSLLFAGSSAAAGSGDEPGHHGSTLRFDVRFSPFSYTDLGAPGPSAADLIVFNDRLLQHEHQVGHEVGNCVVVDASGLANCTAVLTVDGRGSIAYSLENAPPPRKSLIITGGSGSYRSAGGEGVLEEHGDGTGTLTLSIDEG
jgi:hypothetical protein